MGSETCPVCFGSGTGPRRIQTSPSYYTYESCGYCGGTGRVWKADPSPVWKPSTSSSREKKPGSARAKGSSSGGGLIVLLLIGTVWYFSSGQDDSIVRDHGDTNGYGATPAGPGRMDPVAPEPSGSTVSAPLADARAVSATGDTATGTSDSLTRSSEMITGEPVRVGGTIKPPTKIRDIRPRYPAIAQSARVQGLVIIEAVVGPDGRVQNARVLRSVPLLDQAALDAVRQWEYTPTLLNGLPVPVIMTVTVRFTLDER